MIVVMIFAVVMVAVVITSRLINFMLGCSICSAGVVVV